MVMPMPQAHPIFIAGVLLCIVLADPVWSAATEEVHISGHASVVDGDTLDIGPVKSPEWHRRP